MCGRVAQVSIKTPWIFHRGQLAVPASFMPRYNIAPTSELLVVRENNGDLAADLMRWGLVPSWWKDAAKLPAATFNARAETIADKPAFRNAFKQRRCIIPVDGFYEWVTVPGKVKQPFYVRPRAPESLFALAGVWDYWETQDGAMASCAVITTEPNDLMGKIHNRMPVILREADFDSWLNPNNLSGVGLQKLLAPCDPAGMEAYPVGPVRGDGPELVARAGAAS